MSEAAAIAITTGSSERTDAGRTLTLAYGVTSYAVGMTALTWFIATVAGLCPLVAGPIHIESTVHALWFNLGLVALFGVQHSVMARPGFKAWWTRHVPAHSERSTFVLVSGVALGLVVWLWQPLPGTVWSVETPALRVLLWTTFAAGWLYLVAATFATNHFDLFGLRQAYVHFRGRRYQPIPFVTHWMYRYSRHPMMTGIVVGLWATPDMSFNHLAIAAAMTVYIVIGVWHEERDLVAQFGGRYLRYRRDVGALLPRFGFRR